MFKLQPNPTFKCPVSIPVPGGKSGAITVLFNHKGRKALQEFFGNLGAEGESRTDVEMLSELISGWEGVDEKFSEEALETLLDAYPGAAMALFETYRAEVLEARVKNSK